MLQDALDSSQSLNHVGSVVVQVPEFAVVFLVGPPEGVLLEQLVLLELLPHSPSFVVGKSQSVLLEEGVYTGNTVIPTFLQIVKRQSSVLSLCFLSLDRILCPNPLAVHEL